RRTSCSCLPAPRPAARECRRAWPSHGSSPAVSRQCHGFRCAGRSCLPARRERWIDRAAFVEHEAVAAPVGAAHLFEILEDAAFELEYVRDADLAHVDG